MVRPSTVRPSQGPGLQGQAQTAPLPATLALSRGQLGPRRLALRSSAQGRLPSSRRPANARPANARPATQLWDHPGVKACGRADGSRPVPVPGGFRYEPEYAPLHSGPEEEQTPPSGTFQPPAWAGSRGQSIPAASAGSSPCWGPRAGLCIVDVLVQESGVRFPSPGCPLSP